MSGSRHGDEQGDGPLESAGVAPTRFELRLDDALKAAAQREADAEGIDLAEFVRQCILVRLNWVAVLRGIQEGLDPEDMLDTRRLGRLLAQASAQLRDENDEASNLGEEQSRL